MEEKSSYTSPPISVLSVSSKTLMYLCFKIDAKIKQIYEKVDTGMNQVIHFPETREPKQII